MTETQATANAKWYESPFEKPSESCAQAITDVAAVGANNAPMFIAM